MVESSVQEVLVSSHCPGELIALPNQQSSIGALVEGHLPALVQVGVCRDPLV